MSLQVQGPPEHNPHRRSVSIVHVIAIIRNASSLPSLYAFNPKQKLHSYGVVCSSKIDSRFYLPISLLYAEIVKEIEWIIISCSCLLCSESLFREEIWEICRIELTCVNYLFASGEDSRREVWELGSVQFWGWNHHLSVFFWWGLQLWVVRQQQ